MPTALSTSSDCLHALLRVTQPRPHADTTAIPARARSLFGATHPSTASAHHMFGAARPSTASAHHEFDVAHPGATG